MRFLKNTNCTAWHVMEIRVTNVVAPLPPPPTASYLAICPQSLVASARPLNSVNIFFSPLRHHHSPLLSPFFSHDRSLILLSYTTQQTFSPIHPITPNQFTLTDPIHFLVLSHPTNSLHPNHLCRSPAHSNEFHHGWCLATR